MCLDLAVRQATGNGMRLDETIAALCRAYEHEAFNREQLVDHFHGLTGADITPILEQYADRAGVIPREVLDTTFTALEKLGAFGQVRVAKSRRAHTRPPWHHGKL
jgi:predicted metalloprotease with PDZ domain